MRNQGKPVRLFAVLLAALLLLCACSANAVETAKQKKNTAAPAVTELPAVAEPTAEPGPLDEAQRIADYITGNAAESLLADCEELIRLIVAIVKTSKDGKQ